MNFFNKEFRKISLENIDKSNMFWAWIGSFLGIIAISYFHMDFLDENLTTICPFSLIIWSLKMFM